MSLKEDQFTALEIFSANNKATLNIDKACLVFVLTVKTIANDCLATNNMRSRIFQIRQSVLNYL